MPRTRRFLGLWLAGWLLALGAPAGAQPDAIPEIDIPYQKFVLDNGLTLIVHEDRKAPIVAVNVWYHVGSKDEKPGKTGFAHLFEHLMFQGSEHHDDEYFRPLERAGATDANGTTSQDRTNYFQNVPTPALDLALWLESDRMGHLLGVIDQARLDEQRGVVQNEKRQRENAPYGKAWELIAANTYPAGHPYSWPVIGSMEDLNAAALEDVHDWFRRYYGAANAVIVIAGDISPAEARRKVEHYFGDIPAGPPVPRHKSWIAKMQGERRQTMQDRVPQARLYKVWNVPPAYTREAADLQLTGDLLAGGKTSRLYERLVYREQLATDVSAVLDDREIGSQFLIWATAKPGVELARLERALDEELARFLRAGPAAAELNRVRTALFADIVRGSERIGGFGGKSDILASSEVFGGSPDAYQRSLRHLREATPARLRQTAQAWLGDGVYVLEVHPFPEYRAQPGGADRSRLPSTGTPPELRLPPVQRFTLDNGLKVLLAERRGTPMASFNLILDAGFATDAARGSDPARPGLASLALDMLDEGTQTRDALTISAELERLGAILSTGSSLDSSSIALSAVRPLYEPALAIFADVIQQPAFPAHELDRLKKQRLAAIQQEKAQPVSLAQRVLPPLLYGPQHPYGLPLTGSGTEESVSAIDVGQLRRFHRDWIRPDNATLVVVGDIGLGELRPLLEKHLGDWRRPAAPLPRKSLGTVPLPQQPRVFLMDRPGAEQSVVIAGHVADPFDGERKFALDTLNAILGGQFTSRLNMNLREDKHWSYGARSLLRETKGQQPFMAYAAVQTDRTADAMREILREIEDLRGRRPPTPAELAAAQDSLVLSLPGDHETNAAIGGTLGQAVVFGLPDDYYNRYVSRVRALSTSDLKTAAQALLHPGALTWVVVGDLAKIETAVRELEFGPVQVLDADGRPLR
ncbi:MAG TPA: pitrilysin family protein [Nevskiales bacterium]|nr:pitrilysin family protein [Nevskiales bacterium]